MAIYRTKGTCSREIYFNVDIDGIISDVKFIGGCSGNLQGVARLVVGQNVKDVVDKLSGIKCKNNTSCPDQLAKALNEYKEKLANNG